MSVEYSMNGIPVRYEGQPIFLSEEMEGGRIQVEWGGHTVIGQANISLNGYSTEGEAIVQWFCGNCSYTVNSLYELIQHMVEEYYEEHGAPSRIVRKSEAPPEPESKWDDLIPVSVRDAVGELDFRDQVRLHDKLFDLHEDASQISGDLADFLDGGTWVQLMNWIEESTWDFQAVRSIAGL